MDPDYYLAFDIGASSGRAIAGWLDEGGRLRTEELYRFENGFTRVGSGYYWDYMRLYREMLRALQVCRQRAMRLRCIAIDTWSQDSAFVGPHGDMLALPRCYRDPLFAAHADEADALCGDAFSFYRRCGQRKTAISTLRQLNFYRTHRPELVQAADTFLFIPYLLVYLLTGVRGYDSTLPAIGELADVRSGAMSSRTLRQLGMARLAPRQFAQGEIIGHTNEAVRNATGYDAVPVACIHAHDTSSAVAAIADPGEFLFVSSGTWSMYGAVLHALPPAQAVFDAGLCCSPLADGRTSLLLGSAGMFVIQQCMREWARQGLSVTYPELTDYALRHQTDAYFSFSDIPDTAPSFVDALRRATEQAGFSAPDSPQAVYEVFANSLARLTVRDLQTVEQALGRTFDTVYIVGGGSQAAAVNRRIAAQSGKRVRTGCTEAAAVGNLLWQMLACGALSSPAQALEVSRRSFPMIEF